MTNQQTQTYPTNDNDDNDENFFQKKYIQDQKLVVTPNPHIKISNLEDNTQRKIANFGITPEGKEELLIT